MSVAIFIVILVQFGQKETAMVWNPIRLNSRVQLTLFSPRSPPRKGQTVSGLIKFTQVWSKTLHLNEHRLLKFVQGAWCAGYLKECRP